MTLTSPYTAQPGEPLSDVDRMALAYLAKAGCDCVGVIDDEEKFAAALVFLGLRNRGYVISIQSELGPVYYLTEKGRAAA